MRKLDYEDLRKVVWLSAPALSPDGSVAAYVRGVSEYRTGKNVYTAWELPVCGGEPAPVSTRTRTQRAPAYSPDGRWMAWLSDDSGVSQLWLKNRATNEETSPLRLRHGISAFAFSPDAKRIAFVTKRMTDRDEDIRAEMSAEELEAFRYQQKHAPRVAENLIYKYDDAYGFIEKSCSMIGVMEPDTGAWKIVSDENVPCLCPSFGADCLYFYGRPYRHASEMRLALYRWKEGAAEQLKTTSPIYSASPVYEYEGKPVYIGMTMGDDWWLSVPCAAGGEQDACLFTGDEPCHGVDNLFVGDNHMGDMGACWQKGDEGFWFLSAQNGLPGVWLWQDGKVRPVVEGTIIGFDAPRAGKLLYLKSSYDRPADLWIRDLRTGEETRLTHANSWLDEVSLAKPVEMSVPTRDGKADIHGYVLLPDGQEQCPGVLYVHGGPTAFTVGDGFYFDAQMLASKGMAVFYCDPRGSTGYGRAFMSDQCAWGEESMNDLEDFMEAAIRRFPRIDRERLGVTGGSYGGYTTCKMLIQRRIFKAAVAQRAFVNPATSYGTGDIGFITGTGQTDFQQYMINRARNSMLRDVRNMSVPLLVLHGENDLRCGVEQADQLFVLMRALKPDVPSRLVIFPGENHGVTRAGLMHNQIRHCREMCEWLAKYLARGGEPA
ncbi:MAG: S9 family peptidase [Aristaeellaceae bacterium]